MNARKVKYSLLSFAAVLVSVSFAQEADVRISTPSLEYSHVLSDGSVLKIQQETISYHFLLDDRPRSAIATLYFMERATPGGENPVRVWESAYWMDFTISSLFKPRGFAIGISDDRTSSVALAFWEGSYLRFAEINPHKPLKESFVDDVRRIAGKRKQAKDFTSRDRTKPDPTRTDFRSILPTYFWDAGSANPPKITKIWHDTDGWNMTIAATKPEMHLLLRHGAKEWVWINKP